MDYFLPPERRYTDSAKFSVEESLWSFSRQIPAQVHGCGCDPNV